MLQNLRNKTTNFSDKKLLYEYFGITKEQHFIKLQNWIEKHIEIKNKFLELKKSDYYNWSLFDNEICRLRKEYYSEFPSILLFIYNHNSRFGEICDIMDDLSNQPNVYKSV